MLVGWWLLFGLLTAATYRSSLIAHLSVPAMSTPVDTFEELMDRAGWSWGLEPTYGAEWEWFKGSASPTVRRIFQGIQVQFPDANKEVLVIHVCLIIML